MCCEQNARFMQNRELSWLRFNQRVLEEACDPAVPLGERLRFVTIFASNLDEFFMIRVGSLYTLAAMGDERQDNKSGLTAAQQLSAIYRRAQELSALRDRTYEEINRSLSGCGLCEVQPGALPADERRSLKDWFCENVLPLLSPQVIDANHPFPHLQNKALYVVAELRGRDRSILGIVPVPAFVQPIVYVSQQPGRYVRTENLIIEHIGMVFDGWKPGACSCVSVTRNADITPDEEEGRDLDDDFRGRMKRLLKDRPRLAAVRMECSAPLSPATEELLCKKLSLQSGQIFVTSAPLRMGYVFSLLDKLPPPLRQQLLYPPFAPQRTLVPANMIRTVRQHDVLLSYPFESMEPFLQLVREAAFDPDVLTIKITIYRLSSRARLVEYLCAAAENGKEVTVLIELRARFDEQNNIDWSERLEEAGCRVIYGFDGFKVHSKICLITLRAKGKIMHLTQIGTGNYNEKTAAMYTDLSLITADAGIGADAADFFKNMQTANLEGSYRHLLVSPFQLKKRLIGLIEAEAQKGEKGRIIMKMNSMTDFDIMEKLSEASCAGARIDLIIRGICCLLPGVSGKTENIRVTSIVGRFLEHSRIFCFGEGRDAQIFIGSADAMTRNTERRVEIACPVFDTQARGEILHILDVLLRDNVKARRLTPDGTYSRLETGTSPLCAQEYFMDEAQQKAREIAPQKPAGFLQRIVRRK